HTHTHTHTYIYIYIYIYIYSTFLQVYSGLSKFVRILKKVDTKCQSGLDFYAIWVCY
ncbi:unnamed protein product, partial [Musa textilis]